MKLALMQAQRNLGNTKENPAVGCVIVKNDCIISAGCTGINGRPHAEQNAITYSKNDIKKFSRKLKVPLSYFYKDSFGSISKKFFKGKFYFPTIVGIKRNEYLFRFNGIDETILDEIKLLL